jgi:hypothetical protein
MISAQRGKPKPRRSAPRALGKPRIQMMPRGSGLSVKQKMGFGFARAR